MSEEDKPKLGLRPKLGVKRTTEVSQVKQSFSHGRTHKVVVETKKARNFRHQKDQQSETADLEEGDSSLPTEAAASPVDAVPAEALDSRKAGENTGQPSAPPSSLPKAPPPPFRLNRDEPFSTEAESPANAAKEEPEAAAKTDEVKVEAVAETPAAPADVPAEDAPVEKATETPAEPLGSSEENKGAGESKEEAPAASKAAPAHSSAPKAAVPVEAIAKALEVVKPAKAQAKEPAKVPPKKAPAPQPRELSATEKALQNPKLSLRERQQLLLQLAEEERLRLAEEKRIRETLERQKREAAEKLRLEEKARLEEEEREHAKREAAKEKAAEELHAKRVAAEAAESAPASAPAGRTPGRGARPGGDAHHKDDKTSRGRLKERRRGKLTINRALGGDESSHRRSLAAMRRANEKRQRGHDSSSNHAQTPREVQVPEAITVQELANRMAERGAELVKVLFNMGMATTINSTIDQDTAELLVSEFGHTVKRVSDSDVEIGLIGEPDREEDLLPRAPVVTIMGHVDHGKTSLLDALRGTHKAQSEAGGITQHIGAYQVTTKSGKKITFLDTPGHEAFTQMRARGANVTDIAILVVAADDGIKPQTEEAIAHIKAAKVPMIVAINKVDKPAANPDKVRTDLLQHDVQVEKMGGDVQAVDVSAKAGTGLEELIEKILLQAEIMELKANPDRPAEATVIESKLDKGRGPVATVLIRRGTLHTGDIFVVGAEWGKVRALVDEKAKRESEVGPSGAVEVLGLSGVPHAGDTLSVVESEARAREISSYRQQVELTRRTTMAPASLETMFSAISDKRVMEFPAVVKADVHGTTEAIVAALNKLSTDEIRVSILHSGVGAITESDVTLAKASGAVVIGFNVRANAKAREAASQAGVPLKYYDIIYDLIDEVKAGMAGKLGPEYFENVVGRADVREVFQAGKFGKAAGSIVTEGYIKRNLKARLLRDDVIVYNGSIASLRRFKDDVTEVQKGYECGIAFDNFQDIHEGDTIETFEIEERTRSL